MFVVIVVTRRAVHENMSAAADKLSFVLRGWKPHIQVRTEHRDAEANKKIALRNTRRSRRLE